MTQPSDKNEQAEDKDLSLAKPRRSRRRRIVYWVFVIILSCLFLLLCGAVYIWLNRYALMEDIAVDALADTGVEAKLSICLLYTSPSPRDKRQSRMPSSA